jgi:hypothetical protein
MIVEQEHKGRNSVLSGRSNRQQFEVRVRENGAKKSRFYVARDAGEARRCYKGNGTIIWVNKVNKEKMYNVGEFFQLGDQLLKQLRKEKQDQLIKEQNERRGYNAEQEQGVQSSRREWGGDRRPAAESR